MLASLLIPILRSLAPGHFLLLQKLGHGLGPPEGQAQFIHLFSLAHKELCQLDVQFLPLALNPALPQKICTNGARRSQMITGQGLRRAAHFIKLCQRLPQVTLLPDQITQPGLLGLPRRIERPFQL